MHVIKIGMQELTEDWIDSTERQNWSTPSTPSDTTRHGLGVAGGALLNITGSPSIYCITAALAQVMVKSKQRKGSETCLELGASSMIARALTSAFSHHPYSTITQNRKVGGEGNSVFDVPKNLRKSLNILMRIDPPVVHVEELRRLIYYYDPPLPVKERLYVVLCSFFAQLLYMVARLFPNASMHIHKGRYLLSCRVIGYSFALGWALYAACIPVEPHTSTFRLVLTDFLRKVLDVVEVVQASARPGNHNDLELWRCLTISMISSVPSGWVKTVPQDMKDVFVNFFKPVQTSTRELEFFARAIGSALADIGASYLARLIVSEQLVFNLGLHIKIFSEDFPRATVQGACSGFFRSIRPRQIPGEPPARAEMALTILSPSHVVHPMPAQGAAAHGGRQAGGVLNLNGGPGHGGARFNPPPANGGAGLASLLDPNRPRRRGFEPFAGRGRRLLD